MFTETDLKELLNYHSGKPVLSVYLNTEPAEGSAENLKLKLRSMLKTVDLPEDERVVERYLEHEFDWSGRSLAVFSSVPGNFFKAFSLAVAVRSRVRVNDRPHVKPLADLLDAYGGYGVALVDKQGARLFSFHLGELREQEGVLGESVRRTKRGGGSQSPGRRGGTAGQTNYVEELEERNLKEAAEFAAHFFSENNIRRILLGGTDDTLSSFRSHLPKSWQSLVVGTFPMSMTASHNEVLERALEIGGQAEAQREARLVNAAVTAAAKGRGGVFSLEGTLGALHQGRVQTLLIQDGYRAQGSRCQSCGFITTVSSESCPFCGGKFATITDAVELAVHRVMQAGGEVEVLHNNAELARHGNIGALLRY